MLAKYITPMHISIKLKEAGFSDLCIAKWSNANTKSQDLITRGDFEYSNADLKSHEYAAPLYDQALHWLLRRGYYLQPYLVDGKVVDVNTASKPRWSCNILHAKSYKIIWPTMLISARINQNKYLHTTKELAYNQAILQALNMMLVKATK